MSNSTSKQTADYLRGLEDAAEIADIYAEESFCLAGATVLIAPSEGHDWASEARVAQNIAALIRNRAR